MSEIKRPVNIHKAYHAHIYYDAQTLEAAQKMLGKLRQTFALQVGRVHQKPVGPHPKWSCQIIFGRRDFEQLIPWLESHRGALSVLVHALSGDDLEDHTNYAYWLGDSYELDLSMFEAT